MKLDIFQKALRKKDLDAAILFSQDPSFFYFLQAELDSSFLLIPAKGEPVLFVGSLESVKTNYKQITYKKPFDDLKKQSKALKPKTVGVDESALTVKRQKQLSKLFKTKDVSAILSDLRITKTAQELACIKKACKLTDELMTSIIIGLSKNAFNVESDIKKFIRLFAIEKNCDISFEPIVASGNNASTPHHKKDSNLVKGFLILDIGLKYKGYCSDMTRTVYLGKPAPFEVELYNKMLVAQEDAIRLVKPGVKTKTLESFVRKKLGKLEKHFTHSLGHGLGLKVHESPAVSIKSSEKLEEGMIITIEPGYYNMLGIRIEDDVLVTKNGFELLTKTPKKLKIIPKF